MKNKERIEELEKKVKELEERLEKLERKPHFPYVPYDKPVPMPEPWKENPWIFPYYPGNTCWSRQY